jgi:hypothetical protein
MYLLLIFLPLLGFIISISFERHPWAMFFSLRFTWKLILNLVLVHTTLIFFYPESVFALCDTSSSTNVAEAGAEKPKTRKAFYFGMFFAGIISSILLYKYGFASDDVSRAVSNTNIQIYNPEHENQGCLGMIKQFIRWLEQRDGRDG